MGKTGNAVWLKLARRVARKSCQHLEVVNASVRYQSSLVIIGILFDRLKRVKHTPAMPDSNDSLKNKCDQVKREQIQQKS